MDIFDLRLWPGFKEAGGDISAPQLISEIVIDSRQIASNSSLFIALKGKETDGHRFVTQASHWGAKFAIVCSNYIPEAPIPSTKLLYVKSPLKALQEIAKAYRSELPTKIIAITGSYGKTMVKDLLQQMLKTTFYCQASPESFNSQIGVPLSLFTVSKNHEVAIIEAAISEKNEMNLIANMLTPDFGIITPVGKKHIDQLENIPTLIQELLKLYQSSDRLKWVALPQELAPFLKELSASIHFWNKEEPKTPFAHPLSDHFDLTIPYQISFPDNTIYQGTITSGFQYYLNLLNMTVKAAFQLGVSPKNICKTLDCYVLEPMRKEIWQSPLGMTFINDSYAEDPLSIDQALKFLKNNSGMGRKIFLFAGLKGEHSITDYKRVGSILANHKLDFLFLIGNHPFDPLIEVLSQESSATSILKAASYQEAFNFFKLSMHSDDTVLIKGTKKEPFETVITSFHESLCTNLCQINLAAIEHNIKIIRKKLPSKTRIMVMVKALAYGTNDFRMAKFLQTCGIDILGVSYVEEGVALKRAGVTQDIFVLHAADYEVEKVIKWNLEVGVSTLSLADALAKEAKAHQKNIKVHLHLDTGMGRFGCRQEEVLLLAQKITQEPALKLEGIMTHFASADNPAEDTFTIKQAKMLEEVIQALEKAGISIPWKHAANSAGTLRFSFSIFNMVRIGLAVFGLSPYKDLRLAISLLSRVAGINHCKKGETISYGRSYTVEEEEKKIAVLPIGYFDGIHRHYSGKGNVLIRGKKVPMIGKICMDFMMVDVSSIPEIQEGDPVLIFGEDDRGHYLSLEEFALQGNSIVHELMTCLGPRIQRVFIYEECKETHD